MIDLLIKQKNSWKTKQDGSSADAHQNNRMKNIDKNINIDFDISSVVDLPLGRLGQQGPKYMCIFKDF
jgi:hypothetical protein